MGTFVAPLQGKVDVPLSNFALEYRNNAYVADRVLPRVGVLKQSDLYAIWGQEMLDDPGDEVRAPTAAAIELVQTVSTTNYFCPDHAASRIVADEEPSGLASLNRDPYRWAAQMLLDRVTLLKKESRAMTLLTTAGNYSANNRTTLTGGKKWSDPLNSDPIGDVETAKDQISLIGTPPNTMVISRATAHALKVNASIKARFVTKGGPITMADLVAIFELDVLLADAVLRTAGVKAKLWPDTAWIGYVSQTPNQEDLSFAKTFMWESAPGTAGGASTEINLVYPASRKSKSVDVHMYYDQKITCAEAGYIIIDTN